MAKMYRLIRVAMSRPVLVALALGVFAESALAQQPTQAQTNAIRQSCRADYQTYCASVPAGGSAALGCLKENAATLSPACQALWARSVAPLRRRTGKVRRPRRRLRQ